MLEFQHEANVSQRAVISNYSPDDARDFCLVTRKDRMLAILIGYNQGFSIGPRKTRHRAVTL